MFILLLFRQFSIRHVYVPKFSGYIHPWKHFSWGIWFNLWFLVQGPREMPKNYVIWSGISKKFNVLIKIHVILVVIFNFGQQKCPKMSYFWVFWKSSQKSLKSSQPSKSKHFNLIISPYSKTWRMTLAYWSAQSSKFINHHTNFWHFEYFE